MSTSRLVWIAVAIVGASLESGCSSGPLREGIWELSFHSQRGQNRHEFPLDRHEVRLLVEPKDSGDGEIVEISSLDESDELEPMYGDIEVDEERTVLKIAHRDADWQWRMWGVVRDPENVMGYEFFAVAREFEDTTLEGQWGLRWLRDG